MTPALVVASAWLLFGGTHLLLSSLLREWLVRRIGAGGFVVFYTVIAGVSLFLLAAAIARFGGEGAAGLQLASMPVARWVLGAVALLGAALVAAGLANYSKSPMARFARMLRASGGVRKVTLSTPAAVEQITRHPFFVGIALMMGAHALLADTMAGAVFFAGFVVLALAGIPMQDRKLKARHADVYPAYLAETSAVPFAAERSSSTGVSAWAWADLVAPVVGVAVFAALHSLWRLGYGAPFAVLIAVGGVFAVVRQTLSSRTRSVAGSSD